MFVVVFGNPFSGMTIYGPFADFDSADDYAQGQSDCEWQIINLLKVK